MSKLIVEVCKVSDVVKHPNADKLSIVTVKGWCCITGLNQYSIGDLVVFVPPDCIIPENIIDKYGLTYLKGNGRTGTVKLRGMISQGLILDLPDGDWKEGDNVADYLGITKYEQPESPNVPLSGVRSKSHPDFDKYTDIQNIKNFDRVFTEKDIVVITEKIHGSNSRFALLKNTDNSIIGRIKRFLFGEEYEYVYGSHNVQLKDSGNNIWKVVSDKYNLKDKLEKDMIIYGEVYGKGVQDLTYGLDDVDLIVFDVKKNGKYLDWDGVVEVCHELGLKHVPVLYVGNWSEDLIEELTDGKSLIYPPQIREGIVIKTFKESNSPYIGRKILKSVSADYLTRKNGTEYK